MIYEDGPLPLQADRTRTAALAVSACASLGLITTFVGTVATRHWRLTPAGVDVLFTGEVYL